MKTALITGITGQDGSYLADLLLQKEYVVVGLHRRSSTNNTGRINHLIHHKNFILEEFDLTDPSGINTLVKKYQPEELYNLGAQSHVGTSFKQPTTTFEIDAVGVINILEAIKNHSIHTKFYQAGTSEMFGRNYETDSSGKKYQNENTRMLPQSPYGVAKLASHHMIQIYRSAYNLFCCCGILFNHESPRRGENFVTRKITKYIGQIVRKETTEKLQLGNLDAHRDWGHASDYVMAMWLMLQQDTADDFVISSGETHSVQEFLEKAFSTVNLDYKNYVNINSNLFRPAEVEYLLGDCSKAKNILDWKRTYTFDDLIKDMVYSDIKNET
jgi:GDPmannose 4,6-dehydratase